MAKRGRQDYSGELHGDAGHSLPLEVQHADLGLLTKEPIDPGRLAAGQRWLVEPEPELGLGTVMRYDSRRLTLDFQHGAHQRTYSLDSAPLRRVRLRIGERAETDDGRSFIVTRIEERDRLLWYEGDEDVVPETALHHAMQLHTPLQLLCNSAPESNEIFRMREQALRLRGQFDGSRVRGFVGPRIDLLPHQVSVAARVSRRYMRRALLADEVGLGKTIEAGLILHNVVVRGRVRRALVLVPETLVHMWFVELVRKFAIKARILDRDTLAEADMHSSEENPFLRDSIILADVNLVAATPALAHKALSAGWDMVIVDEAHHAREGTDEFSLLARLGAQTRDMLLLTGTPQQKGVHSHFARLHLLDPARYPSYEEFVNETERHRALAALIEPLIAENRTIDAAFIDRLCEQAPGNAGVMPDLDTARSYSGRERDALIAKLLDRLGLGRAVFRNTRAAVGGFPERVVKMHRLPCDSAVAETVAGEFCMDAGGCAEVFDKKDPRPAFVAELLGSLESEKLLIICATREKVEAFRKLLARHIAVDCASFHEGLTLIQRDRNAAWFAQEDGARVLLCSEIGSEGRNFQFVHHLVMLDLPASPELVEQRIGRLDRIGQKHTITIHVPYLADTPHEILARWHNEGLGILDRAVSGAGEVYEYMRDGLQALVESAVRGDIRWRTELDALIATTRKKLAETERRLEEGRDRLQELQSLDRPLADSLISSIRRYDDERDIETLLLALFKTLSVYIEPLGDRTYKLWGSGIDQDMFPGLTHARPLVTFSRSVALAREDIEFLTSDHQSFQSALELFLGSSRGTHVFAVWRAEGQRAFLLDALFVLECIAPPELAADRFLPPTPIRVVVDHTGREYVENPAQDIPENALEDAAALSILNKPETKQNVIPAMARAAESIARRRSESIAAQATAFMNAALGEEIERMEDLTTYHCSGASAEIELARRERQQLAEALAGARPRIDALRLIWRTGSVRAAGGAPDKKRKR